MTSAEQAAVAAAVLASARTLIVNPSAWMPCATWNADDEVDAASMGSDGRFSALQAITFAAWDGKDRVSVRAGNRCRYATKALSAAIPSSSVHAWDRDSTITHSEVLAAFDSAIAQAVV
jgi:hypothetical protein